MVVVSIFGGLGNQMFQYALGRALSLRHHTSLKLDLTAFEIYKLRAYALSHFNIRGDVAYAGPVARLLGRPTNPQLRKLRRRLPYFWLRSVKEQHPYQYDPTVFEKGGNVLLYGFWQNVSYFRPISELLRQEFTLRDAPDRENAEWADRIQEVEGVSVHVRCGDYLTDARTRQVHGVGLADYYRAATSEVAARLKCPHFFVFSDDPAWARANLAFEHPVTYVTHNKEERSHEDLRLMTLCRHHIIANSTFGWWGAWLGTNPGRIVVAPKRWLTDDTLDTGGLFPDDWIRT